MMMVVGDVQAVRDFRELVSSGVGDWPVECAAVFFWGFVEPGHTRLTHLFYRADGSLFLEPGEALSDEAARALWDIPDEVDPDRGEVASVMATYRVSDGSVSVWVCFGDEAVQSWSRMVEMDDFAAEVCPL